MQIKRLALPEIVELKPESDSEKNGLACPVRDMAECSDGDTEWVREHLIRTTEAGTVRGLHFQRPPKEQVKLLRVVRGSIFDVAVDVRNGSPSFGRFASVILSAERQNRIIVPAGFAHGFMTLEPMTDVMVAISEYPSDDHTQTIAYDDPDIAIDWQQFGVSPVVARKDEHARRLRELDTGFAYPA